MYYLNTDGDAIGVKGNGGIGEEILFEMEVEGCQKEGGGVGRGIDNLSQGLINHHSSINDLIIEDNY